MYVLKILFNEAFVFIGLASIQPHDGVQVLELPVAPLVESAIYHGVVASGVDKQHLVEQFFLLALVKKYTDFSELTPAMINEFVEKIDSAKKKNPNAVVVAAGCYVQAAPKEVLADAGVDLVIGNNRKQDLVQILEDYFKEHREEAVIDINKEQEYEELELDFVSDHTRAYIKVQDGCNQFCSYCIIPYTRGRVRSRAKQDVISEIKRIAKNGTKEVVLTGIHLSSYGKDLKDGTDLLDLIKSVQEVDGIQRIRLGSLEPRIITLEFAQELRKLDKFCPHFHLSLQSGCEATLKRMNRHYTPEEYPTYANYNAIDVSKTADIPCDYDGLMGVPITFMDKYNPEQFEIIGIAEGDSGKELGLAPYD